MALTRSWHPRDERHPGVLRVGKGPVTTSADRFYLTIKGRGSRPPNARDGISSGPASTAKRPAAGSRLRPLQATRSHREISRLRRPLPAARPGSCFQRAREDRRGRSSLHQHNGQARCCEASARAAREGPAPAALRSSVLCPAESWRQGKPSPWRRSAEAQPRVIGMLRPPVRPAAAGRTAQSRSPAAGTRPVRPTAALAVPLIRGPGLPRTAGFCRSAGG
jgi:hypothetical protein